MVMGKSTKKGILDAPGLRRRGGRGYALHFSPPPRHGQKKGL